MNDNISLHWSFDYDHGSQKPNFADRLLKLLNTLKKRTSNDTNNEDANNYIKQVYEILPNFWEGYNSTGETLAIGNVVIERNCENGQIWKYNVQYQNETSGEEIRSNFSCRNDIYRTLLESWQVDVQNQSGDEYSKLVLAGNFLSDTEIQLRANDIEITTETVDNSIPLTTNWALFDVIPTNANSYKQSESFVEIALFDGLEFLRTNCLVGYLDSVQEPFSLDGYFLYGGGLLPSFWWVYVDQTVIVSTVLETYVLKEVTRGVS